MVLLSQYEPDQPCVILPAGTAPTNSIFTSGHVLLLDDILDTGHEHCQLPIQPALPPTSGGPPIKELTAKPILGRRNRESPGFSSRDGVQEWHDLICAGSVAAERCGL